MKKLDARFISGIDLTDIPEITELTGNEKLVIDDGTGNKLTSIDKIISHGRPGPELVTTDNSVLFTTINENDTKICKIKDYDSDLNYVISVNKGSIGPIQSDGTFTYTAPDITDSNDTTDTISIYYTFATMMSATSRYDLTIKYVPIEADGVLSNTDFVANKSQSTNGLTVNTNLIKFDNENNISILSNTTNTELHTLTNINTSNKIVLVGNDKITHSGYPDNVTETTSIDVVDVFNDGSGVALYQLDGNANDTGGNYNGTWHGTEQYDTGKFGQGAKFNGSSYIDTHINSFPSVITLSFWFKQGIINTSTNQAYFHFSKDDENTLVLWQYVNSNLNKKMFFYTNDNIDVGLSNKYDDNKWHHLVVISTGEILVDGVQVLTINSVNMTQINRNFIIGADRDADSINDYLQNGTYIDQVRIFNRALTTEEVTTLYNEKKYLADISSFNLTNPPTKAWFVEEYYEKPVEQESGDNDWAEIKDTTIYYKPNEITVLSDTTATDLSTTTEVVQSQPVILVKQDNAVITGNLGTVTETSPIDVVDVFNDGSGVALWQFEGNANDTGGNYNGTWSGTEQYDTGKFGQGAKFDGNSYIDFGSYVTCNAISLWCKLSNNNDYQIFFRKKNAPTDINLCFHKVDKKFYINDNSTYENNTLINYENWYHIVIVRNSATSYTFYLNGNNDGTVTTNSLGDSLYLRLSGIKENGNHKINGLIDQVRIFNRALTAEEVTILYNEKKYLADISSYNLDNPPIKAFKDDKINVYIDIENTKQSIVDDVDPFKDNSGIALYQFEGNANDTGGNYNGTWSGTEQYDTGKFGQAAKFDGSSYINFGNNLWNSYTSGTFSCWFNLYNTTDDTYQLFSVASTSNENAFLSMQYHNNKLRIGTNKPTTNSYVYGSTSINSYQWYHAIFQSNGTNWKIFVNGNEENLTIQSGSNIGYWFNDVIDGTMNYVLGVFNRSSGYFAYFNGLIDQVRIFNRTLTEQEVSALYNEEWYKFQNFDKVNAKEINYNNSNLISVYDDYSKTGRAIQRKIEIENKNVEVVTPFNSDLYKYTT